MSSDKVIPFGPISGPAPLVELTELSRRYPEEYVVVDDYSRKRHRALEARRFEPTNDAQARVFVEIRNELKKRVEAYAHRRQIENQIAEYLDRNGLYPDLVGKLHSCRQSGSYGYRKTESGENKPIVAWDIKCNLLRLCPDESRQEAQRLAERYVPAIAKWQREKRGRQIQYCVLTWPNIKPGGLKITKRWMFSHLNRWLKGKSCAAVRGCLAVQEDPLAADGTWNVHINLILLVEGHFDWKKARAAWYCRGKHLFPAHYKDFQVHFARVGHSAVSLARAVLELVKYSAKHVSGDHAGRSHVDTHTSDDRGAKVAPGIIDWPSERFVEWWEAGKGFRRTRSYGALYKVPEPDRDQFDCEEVTWCGRIKYDPDARAYTLIDLIQGDNSAPSGAGADGPGPDGGPDPPR